MTATLSPQQHSWLNSILSSVVTFNSATKSWINCHRQLFAQYSLATNTLDQWALPPIATDKQALALDSTLTALQYQNVESILSNSQVLLPDLVAARKAISKAAQSFHRAVTSGPNMGGSCGDSPSSSWLVLVDLVQKIQARVIQLLDTYERQTAVHVRMCRVDVPEACAQSDADRLRAIVEVASTMDGDVDLEMSELVAVLNGIVKQSG